MGPREDKLMLQVSIDEDSSRRSRRSRLAWHPIPHLLGSLLLLTSLHASHMRPTISQRAFQSAGT